jgi:hypothetical protein
VLFAAVHDRPQGAAGVFAGGEFGRIALARLDRRDDVAVLLQRSLGEPVDGAMRFRYGSKYRRVSISVA